MTIEAFRIKSVLGRGISLFFRNLTLFLPVLLVTIIPLVIVMVAHLTEETGFPMKEGTPSGSGVGEFIDLFGELVILLGGWFSSLPTGELVILLGKFLTLSDEERDYLETIVDLYTTLMVIFCWLSVGITYGVVSLLRREEVGGIKILIQSLKSIPRLLPLMLVLSIGYMIVMVLLIILIPMVPIIGPIAVWALLLWLSVLLWVALPAAVIEKTGSFASMGPGLFASMGRSFASMGRSIALTKGYRWKVLAIIIIIAILFVLVLVPTFIFASDLTGGRSDAGAIIFAVLLQSLAILSATGISSSVAAVGYHDLRIVKEGVGTEQIARQFD